MAARSSSLRTVDLDESSGVSYGEQLRNALSEQAVRVIDLFREWDEDGSGAVDKKEFRKAMPMLGLEVPKKEIDALFDSWDPDGSGSLTLKELDKKLRRGAEVQLDDKLKARATHPVSVLRPSCLSPCPRATAPRPALASPCLCS